MKKGGKLNNKENKKENRGKNKAFIENQFKPGVVNNPNGRPKGSKNYTTLFDEACEKIAKERGYTSGEEVKAFMVKQGVEKALGDKKGKGADFRYFKVNVDKVFGKEGDDTPKGLVVNINNIKKEYE